MKTPDRILSQRDSTQLKIDFIVRFGKLIAFVLLAVVCTIVLVSNWSHEAYGLAQAWYILAPLTIVFLAENAVKTWALKSFRSKIACYVIDSILLLLFTIFSDGLFISTLYIIILSQFYLEQQLLLGNVVMCASSIVIFLVSFTVSRALAGGAVNIVAIFSGAFNDLILILLHFFIFNFTLQMYRKNREITAAMTELGESNEKLQKLNDELKEITLLEERQRIAKDIHDTAGHSITTVIMQTEAARLVIDENPEEAKRRIAAANLQAKHALEELRESVHLLSGMDERTTLRDALLRIIHESIDGTDIAIRYEIDDIDLCDAKRRFVCNSLKEGISNGLRHGNASAFWFEFKVSDAQARFLLSDNGSGMEISELKEGFGLSGMQKRAESLGGVVWFATEPDEGFEIHMTLPLDGKKE